MSIIGMVIAALIQVESGGDAAAIGDSGRAVGVLQMWPIAVDEANRLERIEAKREGRQPRTWTYKDRRDRHESIEMCAVTLRWHYRRGVTDPVELGGRWRNPNGDAPRWYLNKVGAELKRTE